MQCSTILPEDLTQNQKLFLHQVKKIETTDSLRWNDLLFEKLLCTCRRLFWKTGYNFNPTIYRRKKLVVLSNCLMHTWLFVLRKLQKKSTSGRKNLERKTKIFWKTSSQKTKFCWVVPRRGRMLLWQTCGAKICQQMEKTSSQNQKTF